MLWDYVKHAKEALSSTCRGSGSNAITYETNVTREKKKNCSPPTFLHVFPRFSELGCTKSPFCVHLNCLDRLGKKTAEPQGRTGDWRKEETDFPSMPDNLRGCACTKSVKTDWESRGKKRGERFRLFTSCTYYVPGMGTNQRRSHQSGWRNGSTAVMGQKWHCQIPDTDESVAQWWELLVAVALAQPRLLDMHASREQHPH